MSDRIPRRLAGRLAREVRRMVRPARLLLAAKTALAATIAWVAGGFLPGGLGEYSYYASLGVLVAMGPTLAASLRSSLQTLTALALGIGVAWVLIMSPLPAWAAIALAVGIGTVLAGYGRFGAGAEYVPIAAMFVLIIGGRDPDGFSAAYLLQMALGAAIGVAVNLLVAPPLRQQDAAAAISAQRTRSATLLNTMADAVGGAEVDWDGELTAVRDRMQEVTDAVRDARESRRANPRTQFSKYDIDEDVDDLRTLGRVSRHLDGLGELLRGSAGQRPLLEASEPARAVLADALRNAASVIEAWEHHRSTTLDQLQGQLDAIHPGSDGDPFEPLATARYLLRSLTEDVTDRLPKRDRQQ